MLSTTDGRVRLRNTDRGNRQANDFVAVRSGDAERRGAIAKFRTLAAAGTLFAIVGVAVVAQASPHGSIPLLSLLAILGSVLSFAQAAVLVRRLPKVHPVTMNAVGMTAAAAVLFLGSLVAGDRWALPQHGATWWALGYLVVAGSVLNFVFYLLLIRGWGASRAAYVFVTIPLVTIVLSAWLDNESLTAGLVLGTPLILLGVYFGALRDPARNATTVGPQQDG